MSNSSVLDLEVPEVGEVGEVPEVGDHAVLGGVLGGVPLERLEAEITTLAAHLTAAMCRWLLLVGEYDRRRAYEPWECLSMAHWLNVHAGVSLSTARQHVAVARKLAELPAIRESFGRGEVSFSRVRAICRVATLVDEHRWLDLARNATGSQIERIVHDTIRAEHVNKSGHDERIEAQRKMSWWIDDDGMYHLTAVLPPDVGAILVKTHTTKNGDNGDDYDQRCVDGFARVLGRAAQQLDTNSRPGCCATHDDAAARVEAPLPPVLTIVHRYPNGTARLDDGPPISVVLADRAGADGDEIVATHSGEEIRYGRRRKRQRRAPSKPMRRYLVERDRCCQFPGCGQRKNLHGSIHNRGWSITGNPNEDGVVFHNPDGRAAPASTDTFGDPTHVSAVNGACGIVPGPDTITPRGRGERYDHELTVWITTNFFGRNQPPDSEQTP